MRRGLTLFIVKLVSNNPVSEILKDLALRLGQVLSMSVVLQRRRHHGLFLFDDVCDQISVVISVLDGSLFGPIVIILA